MLHVFHLFMKVTIKRREANLYAYYSELYI